MPVTRVLSRAVGLAAAGAMMAALVPSPAHATIHPIIQSVNCAAATAWANAPVADPPGQTPEGLTAENVSVAFPFLTISFPDPLEFSQSDFRALIATGFIDEVVTDEDGLVTSLVVDLRNVPQALSGQGGAHCANG